MIKELFFCGVCEECRKSVWLWHNSVHGQHHAGTIYHSVCVDPTAMPDPDTEQTRVEQIIRDEFEHFDDVYLLGGEHRLMRQRTGRLCEDIVRTVLREMH